MAKVNVGTLEARARISVSPRGLLALSTCVSMILLGSAAIMVAARFNPR
ncbi:hypothetical protein [Sphingomonas sp.]